MVFDRAGNVEYLFCEPEIMEDWTEQLNLSLSVDEQAKLAALRAARDRVEFGKKCLANIAGAGKFSSDRTIQEYWDELWAR